MTDTTRYVPTDERHRELLYLYTSLGYVVQQLGEQVADDRVEPTQIETLRESLAALDTLADEIEREGLATHSDPVTARAGSGRVTLPNTTDSLTQAASGVANVRIREIDAAEIERLVDDLWLSLARQMTEASAYDELAGDAREHALAHKREQCASEGTRTLVAVTTPSDDRGDPTDTATDERANHSNRPTKPDDERFVGYVTGRVGGTPPIFTRGRELRIEELFVEPSFRRQGIATELLARLREWGHEQGCETAAVDVLPDNDAARAVYENAGFDAARVQYRTRLTEE